MKLFNGGHELARRDDPIESRLSGDEVAADGTQSRMILVALEALRKDPGLTANELEAATGLLDGKLRKRLNDLRKKGLAFKGVSRLSRVSGKLNATWYAIASVRDLSALPAGWESAIEDLNQRELF